MLTEGRHQKGKSDLNLLFGGGEGSFYKLSLQLFRSYSKLTCDGMRMAFLPPNQDSPSWDSRGHAALDTQSLRDGAFPETAPKTRSSHPLPLSIFFP